MAERQFIENLRLFEAEDQEDQVLLLHPGRLLESLNSALMMPTTPALRNGLADLRSAVYNADSELHDISEIENPIEISQRYLRGELDQILSAQTAERAHYYLRRLIKGLTEERTSAINDINLNRWKEYEDILTESLWLIDRRDSSGAHTAGYWGNYIPQIPNQMMKRYTRRGEWVLDTFAGSGTTFIEGQRLGRNTIGSELQPHVADHARALITAEPNQHDVISEIIVGDSAEVDYRAELERYGRKSVQLVMMHPPYFDIIKFSNDKRDLSNATSVEAFLEMMGCIVDNAARVLDRGRYLVLVIGDKYEQGEWIPLGFQTMNVVMQRGFQLKSIIVKNFEETTGKRNQKELWRYRALVGGFYIFKHEYIFILKKQ